MLHEEGESGGFGGFWGLLREAGSCALPPEPCLQLPAGFRRQSRSDGIGCCSLLCGWAGSAPFSLPSWRLKTFQLEILRKSTFPPSKHHLFFFFFPNPQVQKGERKRADRAAEPCADPSLSTENQLPIPLSFCLSPSSPAGPSSALPRQLLHIQVPMSPAKALTDLHSSAGEPDWFEGTEAAFPGPEWLCGKKKKKKATTQPNPLISGDSRLSPCSGSDSEPRLLPASSESAGAEHGAPGCLV